MRLNSSLSVNSYSQFQTLSRCDKRWRSQHSHTSSQLLSLPYFSSSIVSTLLRLIIFSKFQSCLVSSLSPIQEFNFHLYCFCLQFIHQSEMVVLVFSLLALIYLLCDLTLLYGTYSCILINSFYSIKHLQDIFCVFGSVFFETGLFIFDTLCSLFCALQCVCTSADGELGQLYLAFLIALIPWTNAL